MSNDKTSTPAQKLDSRKVVLKGNKKQDGVPSPCVSFYNW